MEMMEGGGGHRPVWIALSGDTEDTAGRVGGCQRGKGASSLSSLFHAPAPLFSLLPPPSFLLPPSTPLSCCFWLLVGVRRRQINRRGCLSLPVGNSSALLTLHYLALGYLNPLIYYGEHSVMIPPAQVVSKEQNLLRRSPNPERKHTYTRAHLSIGVGTLFTAPCHSLSQLTC